MEYICYQQMAHGSANARLIPLRMHSIWENMRRTCPTPLFHQITIGLEIQENDQIQSGAPSYTTIWMGIGKKRFENALKTFMSMKRLFTVSATLRAAVPQSPECHLWTFCLLEKAKSLGNGIQLRRESFLRRQQRLSIIKRGDLLQ